MASEGRYVITRYSKTIGNYVPMASKRFDDLDAALDEAVRLQTLKRYRDEPLLFVDLASAYAA